MRFSSNADEIRFYVKQLLKDYEPHSRKEIVDYVRKTEHGSNFTGGMITGALKSLVDNDRAHYENPDRGWYHAISTDEAGDNNHTVVSSETSGDTNSLAKRVHEILTETKDELIKACTFNPLLDTDTNLKLSQTKSIGDLIKQIDAFDEKFKTIV